MLARLFSKNAAIKMGGGHQFENMAVRGFIIMPRCICGRAMRAPTIFSGRFAKTLDFLWNGNYNIIVAQKGSDELSPRTGRPKSDKPKSFEIKARIDAETNQRLQKFCDKTGKTRTQVVREGIELILAEKK